MHNVVGVEYLGPKQIIPVTYHDQGELCLNLKALVADWYQVFNGAKHSLWLEEVLWIPSAPP